MKDFVATASDHANTDCLTSSLFSSQLSVYAATDPPPPMKPSPLPSNPSTPVTKPGTINPNRGYCTVVRTRMNTHSLVMAAEVDAVDHVSAGGGGGEGT